MVRVSAIIHTKVNIINVDIVRVKNMKICVTSQGDNLEARVDPRFGRCQYFLIIDTDTLKFESIKNPNIVSRIPCISSHK